MAVNTEILEKTKALAKSLGLKLSDITFQSYEFETPEGSYLVLTEEEVLESIKDLCDDTFFNSQSILEFLERNGLSYSDMYNEEWLRDNFDLGWGEIPSEDLEDIFSAIETNYIKDQDFELTKEMIDLDKAAEFIYDLDSASAISFYDGNYKEIGEYFIVRTA